MSEKNEIVIDPATIEMAEKIDKNTQIDKKTGIVTEESRDAAYIACLPEQFTPESVIALRNHDNTFAAAAVYSSGNKSQHVLAKNKDLESTTTQLGMLGKSHISVEYHRKQEFPNPKEKGATITKYGTTTVEVHHAAGHNAGELKKVRNWLKTEAENAQSK